MSTGEGVLHPEEKNGKFCKSVGTVTRTAGILSYCMLAQLGLTLCFDNIACHLTHPSFNHQRSGFSGRCCPTVEHSAAERHVGIVNICFQETLEDPSLQSFFPRISCSACAQTMSFRILSSIFFFTFFTDLCRLKGQRG